MRDQKHDPEKWPPVFGQDHAELKSSAMSMIDRSIDGMAFLSGQLGAMLRRRLRELGGIALLSIAMMAALALATWSVHDPSLSHATDARVHNLLGRLRRHRRRSDDAIAGLGLAGAAAADRHLGLSAARPSPARPRTFAHSALGVWRRAGRDLRRVPAARNAIGRCRAGSAGWSATPCCGRRRCFSARRSPGFTVW